MKLTVTKGNEWELRDEQNRLVARVYDVYSKTVRNPENDSFFAIEKRAEDLANEMADALKCEIEVI
jgi:hypothetical protein